MTHLVSPGFGLAELLHEGLGMWPVSWAEEPRQSLWQTHSCQEGKAAIGKATAMRAGQTHCCAQEAWMSRAAVSWAPHSEPELGPHPGGLEECGEQTRPP